jgi:hypothetical protein
MRKKTPGLIILTAAMVIVGLTAVPALADPPVGDCDVSCSGDPTGGTGGVSGGTGGVSTSGTVTESFVTWPTPAPANDVATGPDGSVWIVSDGGTFCVALCTRSVSFGQGGQRLAVDPSGLPWIVGFDNTIWRGNADGSLTRMPGLANDIGIGANGDVWVIGTNSQNGSFEVWHLVNGGWVADPGSGQEIDVDASGHPMVNGSDGKIWIKNGGANQGWTQLSGLANDMAVKHNPNLVGAGQTAGFGQSFWITGLNHLQNGASHDLGVWFFDGGATWSFVNEFTGGRTIAVDNFGRPWVVDSFGNLLLGGTAQP